MPLAIRRRGVRIHVSNASRTLSCWQGMDRKACDTKDTAQSTGRCLAGSQAIAATLSCTIVRVAGHCLEDAGVSGSGIEVPRRRFPHRLAADVALHVVECD